MSRESELRDHLDKPEVVSRVERAVELPREYVERVLHALHDSIDRLVLDGCSIIAPPFSLMYSTDSVADRFLQWSNAASEEQLDRWRVGDFEVTAGWLGLDVDEYLDSRVLSDLMVIVDVTDRCSVEPGSEEEERVARIVLAWFDTFDVPRRYRLSEVGLERDLEQWLIENPERLRDLGYDVSVRHRQFVLPDKRRPDLIYDLVDDDGRPGTLVVELKAVQGYRGAVDQLRGYVDTVESLRLAPQPVRGLLIADGFSPGTRVHARSSGVETMTLSRLGYRDGAPLDGLDAGGTPPLATARTATTGAHRTYAVIHAMSHDGAAPAGTVTFGPDGRFESSSDDRMFATFAPWRLHELTFPDISAGMKMYRFLPIEEDS